MLKKVGLLTLNLLFLTNSVYAVKEPAFDVKQKTNDVIIEKQLYLNNKTDSLVKLLSTLPENLNIGVMVVDATTHKVLFKKNENRYFIPASNQKLFTAYAALNYLKPDFIYQTYLFADLSKVNNFGKLEDNLYLKFTGDPSLTFTQLNELISTLAKADIRQIGGDIIIDDTAFNQVALSPGMTWDDSFYCFGSPLTALIVNRNCLTASIHPADKEGELATLNLPDYPQDMQFKSVVKTFSPNTLDCKLKVFPSDENTYTISGCIKTNDIDQTVAMSVKNPRNHIKALIFYLLNKYQIEHKNDVKFVPINHPVKLLATINSPTLPALVTTMLKDSDNTIANALFKTMGSLHTQRSGSWSNGRQALHTIIKNTAQLDLPGKTLLDGSGGSRYNYLTPHQIVSLLEKVYASSLSKQFISSLPLSGKSGTLKDRMQNSILTGKIYAKTGTETGVTSLAGYMKTQNKHTLIFAIIINGFVDSTSKYKQIEERICEELVKGF